MTAIKSDISYDSFYRIIHLKFINYLNTNCIKHRKLYLKVFCDQLKTHFKDEYNPNSSINRLIEQLFDRNLDQKTEYFDKRLLSLLKLSHNLNERNLSDKIKN